MPLRGQNYFFLQNYFSKKARTRSELNTLICIDLDMGPDTMYKLGKVLFAYHVLYKLYCTGYTSYQPIFNKAKTRVYGVY